MRGEAASVYSANQTEKMLEGMRIERPFSRPGMFEGFLGSTELLLNGFHVFGLAKRQCLRVLTETVCYLRWQSPSSQVLRCCLASWRGAVKFGKRGRTLMKRAVEHKMENSQRGHVKNNNKRHI
jgi:hypothetical protein